jgi:hypothetical protein
MDTLEKTVRIHAHYDNVKKLGHWTAGRLFEIRARRSAVTFDLRSPEIPAGDIEIELDIDHSMVKLLVPEDAVIDHWDLRFDGRGRVKDWQKPADQGRRIRLTGKVAHGEIRVNRGGVAVLAAMFSRAYVEDLKRAGSTGTMPTVADPEHVGRDTSR